MSRLKMPRNPLIVSFYLPALVLSLSQGLLVPVLPLYARDIATSYRLVGLMLAGDGLGMLLADIPAGLLLRRLGNKGSMLLGIGSILLSTVTLFWAGSAATVLACRLITGFGMSIYSVARHAFIADVVRLTDRGRALALLGGVFRLGRFAGPMIGGAIAARYGLRAVFPAFGSVCAIAWLSVAAFVRLPHTTPSSASNLPQSPSRLPDGDSPEPSLRSLRRSLSHSFDLFLTMLKENTHVLGPAGAGYLFSQMVRAGRAIIIPLYAADVLSLDVGAIGLIISIASAVEASLFPVAGLIMDRLGRKVAIIPCFIILGAAMLLLPLANSFTGLLAVAAVAGLGNGLGSGAMMTLGADLAPPDSRGEFLGVWRLVGDVGGTGAPLVVGTIADLLALPAASLVIAGTGLTAAAIFATLVPETLKKRRPD
jgi:MFS family permease